MHQPAIRFPLASRLLLCIESLLLAGLGVCFFAFWDMPYTGFWIGVAGIVLSIFFWLWTARTIELRPGSITMRGGPLWDTVRILRRRTITGTFCIATPFLRLIGCRSIVLFTATGRILLPGLLRSDARSILAWYRE